MDSKAALKTRLENLSPEQRTALLLQISRLREQQGERTESQQNVQQHSQGSPGGAQRYPLSLAQRRLWMLSQMGNEASAAYNISSVFCFDKKLDPEQLQRAWRKLLARHEVLRSTFVQEGHELFQIPRDADGWTLEQRKLPSQPDVETLLLQAAAQEASRPFDLQQDWLLRVIYFAGDTGPAGLVVVIHHSVCDGLSIANMITELTQYYADTDSHTTDGVMQYRDYVEFETRADTSKAKAYWKGIFASAPETLDALLDLPRPVVKDFSGSSVARTLSKPDVQAFEALCHTHNATLYMGLVALVQLLLARFANVAEVTLGTPVAGRPGAQFDKVVGPFVNTIALRQAVDRKLTFPELLHQVRRRVLEGFQHQGLAFDELVTELGFARDASRSPLYDAMLGYTSADDMALCFTDRSGVTSIGRALRIPLEFSKVDLTFHFEKDHDGSLHLDLEYANSVFQPITARRLCDAWHLLAVELPRQPALPSGDFALHSEEDQRLLLEQMNATGRPYPQHSSLVAEFRRSVQRCPDAIAVHAGDVKLNYQALDDLSGQLARTLLDHPAYRPGCRIALMLEKDERALIVMLAILKSRGTYVPLAANTPPERVSDVIAHGEVKLLFAESGRMAELQQLDASVLDTNALLAAARSVYNASPLTDNNTENAPEAAFQPAYLMFTSGSTGKPKGTLIGQHSVLRLVCNTDYHQVQQNERVLLTGSLAFDAATFEIWGPLLNGGCVCIPAGTTLLEVHEFHTLVDHYQVHTAFLTTGLFNQLVDNSASAFSKLKTVLTGGEKISVEHVGKLLRMQPELKLLHVYGPTENTTFSTWHHITMDDLALSTVPIGRPIANSRIYLLDAQMRPVPIGVPGEIYCGGDGIALAYLNQPDVGGEGQSSAFLPDPFLPAGTGRLYRTGDLAKWNHKRELVFMGRNDRQVKIRGFRVELGEVEFHLRTLPEVLDAFVQARGTAGSSELVAWLVTPAGSGPTVAAVREALKGSAPNYMLPSKIVCVERLPLNASGKVDVRALSLPDDNAAENSSDGQLAGRLDNKAEQDLARLYVSVLGLSPSAARGIDREDNFFSLGGDSIRAIQLVSLARSEGYHFTLKDIFASETLAGLAATATVTASAAPESVLRSGPLSPTQLWWLEQCGMPANHFNLSSVFKVATPMNTEALRAALDELLELHPALRLRLDTSTAQQSISDTGRYLLLEAGAGQSRQDCWQQLQQSIDLNAGILLAVGVAQETHATYLAIVVHHLAADEVSGRLFAENLERLYHHHHYQRRPALNHAESTTSVDATHKPVQEALGLINWSAQLKAVVERAEMDNDLSCWQDVVARGRLILQQQTELFADTSRGRHVAVQSLPHSETQALLRLSAALLRMKPQEVLLASFIRAWQRTLNMADCVLSLEGHGRETFDGLGDCSSTMGWFTSLYPFVFASGDLTQLDVYREVKDSVRRLPSKGFTYLPLRYYRGAEARESLTLQPQLSFNYLGESGQEQEGWLRAAGEQAGDDHGATVTEPFKLDVLSRITDGQLELTLRGLSPRNDTGLNEIVTAWLEDLRTLTEHLQKVASGTRTDQCLLSLSDSMVVFASLTELDNTLAALRLPAIAIEEILPLTGMQAGMWLHCSSHPTAYQDQVVLRLQQPLDQVRFASAVQQLVAETQALRTGFAQSPDGDLLQIVFRERTGNYRFLDMREGGSKPGEATEVELTRLRATQRSKMRDLLHDPLFNLTLVQIDTDCFDLIIDFHHMALDGWTSALLLQRLEALYFGDVSVGDRGAASGMRSYFEWLHRQAPGQARDYWQRLLGDYQSRSDVPTHLPRVPAIESAPLFVETRTGVALHARLLQWCEQQGLTINAAVQSLWGIYLGRLTGSDDLVFGATVSGRDSGISGVANIAGMLINTLPVRIRPAEATSFAELVRETAQQFAESMSFGHLTLAEIQTLAAARAGLVTHALVFENYPASDDNVARWQWQPQEIFDPMHFEFGLIVAPLSNDLSFRFVADGSLYLQDKLEKMGADLCSLLATLLDMQQPLDVVAIDLVAHNLVAHGAAAGWTVSANFTADSMIGLLQFHEYISGNSGAVTLLPYDQSVQELINPQSRLRSLRPQQHVVLWRPATDEHGNVMASGASDQLSELAAALSSYVRACPETRVYFVPCPWHGCDWTLYRELSAFAKGALAGLPNAEVLNLESLADLYALQQPCHPPELVFGDIPYTEEFFAAVANRLVRLRDLQLRPPVKVYIVDADDTLWGGIVGEDGVHGIRLDSVHIRLQQKLVDARAAGALICLATKNNEEDVRAVFDQRQMPLRWAHLTRVCAGWRPKSESILALADDLSLGLDSFVFIDDSPLECEQVVTACPGVLAIQLPPEQDRAEFLNHLWLLDARAATREDAARAQMYAEELQRAGARKATGNYAEFLASLDIRVDMRKAEQSELPRTAQLSQRTNQFNTSGLRYTESELAGLLQEADIDIRCISVTDKYGDYGLTGSVFVRRAADAWTVFGFMLSCRVLGRGVEHTILRQLAQEAAGAGVSELRLDFVKLARNSPALQFLQNIDSRSLDQPATNARQFRLPVAEADCWQPGAGDSLAAEKSGTESDATHAPVASSELNTSADARKRSARSSRYYQHLAKVLNSGAGILNELQRQGIIRNSGDASRSGKSSTPPEGATEVMLAELFTELLGHSEIFREDSFHDLGGHSLKAMMLFSRIAARCGLTLDFRDLQAHPTLAQLASRIDSASSGADSVLVAAPVIKALPPSDSYPVSPGQSRLWMLEQLRAAGPSPFHMHATLKVQGAINREALDRALHALLLHQEALRTCFSEDSRGRIMQVVLPVSSNGQVSHNCGIQWFDSILNDAELESMAKAHSAVAFDLSEAPLLRIAAGELETGGSVLFITMHHIISDGWSVGILSRELTTLYDAFSAGNNSIELAAQLPSDGLQFRDFASWQLDWLRSESGKRAAQFWQDHFAQPVEALQLPSSAPRPLLKKSEGAVVEIDIEAQLWTGFTRYLVSAGISDFAGLFAALQLVLARLSGQRNFCIGTAVAGRQHQQLESVIGFFVNILPLRATLDADLPVDAFLRAVATEVNDCLSHQSVPFDTIVSSLDLVRDPGRTPLFDVLLVLQNTGTEDLRFGAHTAEVLPFASGASQYDLTVSAFPAANGSLKLIAEYDSAIYSASNIALILRCMVRTVSALTDPASKTLAGLPWLAESDLARVQSFEGVLFANTSVNNESINNEPELVPDIFRRSLASAAGSISDTAQTWSYRELENEVQRVARLLRAVSQEDDSGTSPILKQRHIGVTGNRSVRSIAAMLAVMEAGAVYIPLDLSNPTDRLLLIIEEGAVDVLLSTDEQGAALASELQQRRQGLRHVCYTDEPRAMGQQDLSVTPVPCTAIAYMIFTSGSTGKPKGVQISHAAFSAMIRQQIAVFGVHATDVCAQFAALSFDASLSEVFLALGTGASLAITPDAARGDIDVFLNWLDENAVTVITLPPVFLRALNKRPLGRLRVLVTAGEAAIAEDMLHYANSLRVLNAYGPTETSVCASAYTVDGQDKWPFGVPIGKPLPGVLLTVRDSAGARVPVGAAGELYIGGPTLARSYFRAPELTAQKFTTFSVSSGPVESGHAPSDVSGNLGYPQRWYRSGDLVRWREDGLLEFVGRIDAQVKVRGYRIEPGEIEYAARLVEGVDDALALVHPRAGLMLYCVTEHPEDSRQSLRTTIVAALGQSLPRHMQPGGIVLLDAFPLSPAGKIERNTLLALASVTEKEFVEPETQAEQVLAQAWCRVLRAERVGRHDDFFALGGDSIKALEVLSAIRSLGFSCELKDFFASPVLSGMAGALTPWRDGSRFREPVVGHIALLPVQNWFLRSRNRDAAQQFHIIAELKVPPAVTEGVLRQSLQLLIQHHDSLRACFSLIEGKWVQEIRQTLNMDEVLYCSRRSDAVATEADQSAVEALACRPFELETDPLLRCILVQSPDGDSESMVLVLHHLIADWVSLRILIADLEALTRHATGPAATPEHQSPPHLLREVADTRCTELVFSPSPMQEVYRKAVVTMDALLPVCGVHSELQTLHLQISTAELNSLRKSLQQQSADQNVDFRLQDVLLATALGELCDLLPATGTGTTEVPLLVESHGRDGVLDLARQVAWLTRARLYNLDAELFRGSEALMQANRILSADAALQPDVFSCVAAESELRSALPALMSFNYLGEFANSQHEDALFSLTGKVFNNAMASTSPVDVPLHMEFYVVDCALEIQVAWSPGFFDSATMQACWERVRSRLACF